MGIFASGAVVAGSDWTSLVQFASVIPRHSDGGDCRINFATACNHRETMPRVTRKIIIEALIRALSQPPAQAGMRLRAERELATLFKVSRPTLRRALATLEEQGILIQQQGSGTYLRRVPMANGRHSVSTTLPVPSAEQLFAREEANESSGAAGQRNRLKLQLWTHLHRYTPSLRLQLESFAEAAVASGHDLAVIGASTDENVYLPPKKIASMLKATPCDGYLLDALVADHALREFEATGKPFIIFSGTPPCGTNRQCSPTWLSRSNWPCPCWPGKATAVSP